MMPFSFFAIDKPDDPVPVKSGDEIVVLYQTDINVWRDRESLQLMVKRIEKG